MKQIKTIALTFSALTVLSTGIALANNTNSHQGIKVTGVVDICSLPSEAKQGSITLTDDNENSFHKLAKISASEAASIANMAYPGKTSEVELENEDGTLIWEVSQYGENGEEVELQIDAGNGYLLAAELEEDDYSFKNWFKNDDKTKKRC